MRSNAIDFDFGGDYDPFAVWRAFRLQHIPGSLHVFAPELPSPQLQRDDDIVVYCTNPACIASIYAYDLLVARGFRRVRRYAGGEAVIRGETA